MALPKLDKPSFVVTIPSTKVPVRFRCMARREEKLLLMAKTGKDQADWVEAIRQVVTNCVVDSNVNIDAFAAFDLEYCFVKLRSASIGNHESLTYTDHEDNQKYTVEVNLDEVVVVFPDNIKDTIDIGEATKLKLKWPSAAAYADPAIVRASNEEDALDALVASCIDKVWMGDQTYDPAHSTLEEIKQFLEGLDIAAWDHIRDWISNMPHLSYWVRWTNSMDTKREIELRTLSDFFRFF